MHLLRLPPEEAPGTRREPLAPSLSSRKEGHWWSHLFAPGLAPSLACLSQPSKAGHIFAMISFSLLTEPLQVQSFNSHLTERKQRFQKFKPQPPSGMANAWQGGMGVRPRSPRLSRLCQLVICLPPWGPRGRGLSLQAGNKGTAQ